MSDPGPGPPPGHVRGLGAQYARTLLGAMPGRTALAGALTMAGGLAEGVGLVGLLPLLQAIGVDVNQEGIGDAARAVARGFARLGLPLDLVSVLGLYVGLIAAQAVLRRWQVVTYAAIQTCLTRHLRQRLQRAVMLADWVDILRLRSSDLTNAITAQSERVGHATYALFRLTLDAVMVVVCLVATLFVSPAASGVALGVGLLLLLLLKRRSRRATVLGERLTRAGNEAYRGVLESLGGIKLAKSYGAEERSIRLFGGLAETVARCQRQVMAAQADTRCWFEMGAAVLLGLVVLVAVRALAAPPATVLILVVAFARVMPRISAVEQSSQQVLSMLPDFAALISLEARLTRHGGPPPSSGRPVRLRQAIRLDGVSVAYDCHPAGGAALADLSLTIHAGQTTAIVGASGAGKSTLADLLLGLLVPVGGRVLVDEVPLTPDRMASWREQIGYVPQDTFLFHDTVRENLLWAQPGATEEETREALAGAAAEFVDRLPGGLGAVVGDRGVRLSGGERQRLALARALLRRPAVLILDEATSSLDSANERRVQAAIERLHGRLTILVITHRLSTVRRADVIYVLEGGRLVESGRWETLLSSPAGRFRLMWEAQSLTA